MLEKQKLSNQPWQPSRIIGRVNKHDFVRGPAKD